MNPIRGAATVEKLEFINKHNSFMIKFGLFIYLYSVARIENLCIFLFLIQKEHEIFQ